MEGIETTDDLLDDTGELDGQRLADAFDGADESDFGVDMANGPDQSVEIRVEAGTGALAFSTVQGDDDPVHLARCAECNHSVKFRSNVTGTGFFLVDADPDAVYGVGSLGRPLCPDGHGEMEVADDQLQPVPEAFANAQAMLERASGEAVQAELPGVFPNFNYVDVFQEIVDQARLVERLKSDYEDKKQEASDAKKSLDKAAELLMKMTLEFERRRRSKGDGSTLAAPQSRALACVWDKAHPDDRCPLCNGAEDRAVVEGVLGAEILPREAQGHADQVVVYRTKLDVAETSDALAGILHDVHPATIAEWTSEQRALVRSWAKNVADAPADSASAFPAELGRPHRAGTVQDGEQAQTCETCGATLKTFDDRGEAYPVLALVRTDCPGATVEPTHHYPDTSRKPKRQRKPRAEAAAEEQAEPAPRAKAAKRPAHKSFPKPSSKKSGKGRQ